MANALEIKIGADVDEAVKNIKAFANTLQVEIGETDGVIEAFEREIDTLNKSLRKLSGSALIQATARLNSLKGAVNSIKTGNLVQGVGNVNKASGQAANTLLNFNRVLQDAPFGIIGVANNIDPLIESFRRLKISTGSTKAAFKDLGSSLAGGAGISIAVSAVLFVLQKFGPEIQEFIFGVDKASKSVEKAAKETKEAADNFADAANAIGGESIAKLDALVRATQNVNLSQKERQRAIQDLQKEYPAYFGNLSKEQIAAGDLGEAYKNLKDDIIKAAKARAAQDVLSKIADQQLALEEKAAQIAEDTAKRIKEARTGTAIITGGGIAPTTTSVTVTREEKIKQAKAGQAAALKDINAEQAKLNQQADFYVKFVDAATGAVQRLDDAATGAVQRLDDKTKKEKELKVKIDKESIDDQLKRIFGDRKLFDSGIRLDTSDLTEAQKQLFELQRLTTAYATKKERKELEVVIKQVSGDVSAPDDLANKLTELPLAIRQQQKAWAETKDSAKQYFDEAIAFAGLIQPLIGGTVEALFSGDDAAKAFANGVKRLVVQLAAAAALAAIISTLFPGAGTFSNLFKLFGGFKLPGRDTGGQVLAGQPYIVGESRAEVFVPQQSGRIMNSTGFSGGGHPQLRTSISAYELSILVERGNQQRGRLG